MHRKLEWTRLHSYHGENYCYSLYFKPVRSTCIHVLENYVQEVLTMHNSTFSSEKKCNKSLHQHGICLEKLQMDILSSRPLLVNGQHKAHTNSASTYNDFKNTKHWCMQIMFEFCYIWAGKLKFCLTLLLSKFKMKSNNKHFIKKPKIMWK